MKSNAPAGSLRRLLRTVPTYSRLLDEYPRARIVTATYPGMKRIKLELLADEEPAVGLRSRESEHFSRYE